MIGFFGLPIRANSVYCYGNKHGLTYQVVDSFVNVVEVVPQRIFDILVGGLKILTKNIPDFDGAQPKLLFIHTARISLSFSYRIVENRPLSSAVSPTEMS